MSLSTAPADVLSTVTGRALDGDTNSIGAIIHPESCHDQPEGKSQTEEHYRPTQHADQTERVHFEDVTAAEDAQQVIVSTIHKSVYGKGLAVEARGNQLLGQMADPSVLQLSQNWANVRLGRKEVEGSQETASFDRVYGAGHRFNSEQRVNLRLPEDIH